MAEKVDMSVCKDSKDSKDSNVQFSGPINISSSEDNDTLQDKLVAFLEDLTNPSSSRKRKFNLGTNELPAPKHPRQNISTPSSTSSPAWEAKKMKVNLIAARAQIIRLEARIGHQDKIRKEMELLFEGEKSSLIRQHNSDQQAIAHMKEKMEVISRRESQLKDDFNMEVNEHRENKLKWVMEKVRLNKIIGQLEDKVLEADSSHNGQMSETRKDLFELVQALESSRAEVKILKEEVEKKTARASQYTTTRNQLEKQTLELQLLTNKLGQLEYERDSSKDWQQQAKTAQNRLSNMAALEKEVVCLRNKERSLREAIGNKLLLEEQVHLLNDKVETMKSIQQKLHDCEVKLAHTEAALEELHAIAKVRGLYDAQALATAFDDALVKQLTAVSDCVQAQSQVAQLNEEIANLKYECAKATAKLTDMQTLKKDQESVIHRLQKRLFLDTKELNSYKQQLNCYEKELTVTLSGEDGICNVALQSARVEQLENALQDYRDLVATYDQEAHIKLVESLRADIEQLRDKVAIAERDESCLRIQRDRLQAQLVTLSDQLSTKELADNPSANAQTLYQFQVHLEAAQEEIKRLKAALQEADGRPVGEDSQLRQELEETQMALQRMENEFISGQEYGELCYMLLGYKIDRIEQDMYRITNIYATSEDYLLFKRCDDGIEMLQTDYAATLGELVELHLYNNSSIPMFLSTLTMKLCPTISVQQDVDQNG